MVESLPILQAAIYAMEQRLGSDGKDVETLKKRGRTEIRLDSDWGSEPIITWRMSRGYQVTGKFRSAGRVRKLVRGISTWQPKLNKRRNFTPIAFLPDFLQHNRSPRPRF